MQGVHESTQSDDDSPRAGLLSPLRAFLLLIAALGAAGLLLSLNRADAPPPATTPPAAEPDYSLTDAEALTRFRELDELSAKAYIDRDTSLIRHYLTINSPLMETNSEEIRQLLQDRVFFDPNQKTRSLRVVSNSETAIEIRQVMELQPKFTNEFGKDVSSGGRLLQVVVWLLHPEDSVWKIHDATVLRTKSISR